MVCGQKNCGKTTFIESISRGLLPLNIFTNEGKYSFHFNNTQYFPDNRSHISAIQMEEGRINKNYNIKLNFEECLVEPQKINEIIPKIYLYDFVFLLLDPLVLDDPHATIVNKILLSNAHLVNSRAFVVVNEKQEIILHEYLPEQYKEFFPESNFFSLDFFHLLINL